MEKIGYKIVSGAAGEGVVLSIDFAVADAEAAIELEKSIGEKPAKAEKKGKAAPAAEKAAPKKGKKPEPEEDDEDEDEDDEDSDEDDEDDEDEDEDEDDEDDEDEDEAPKKAVKGRGAKAAPKGESGKLKLTPALKNATKLREVLVEMKAQGLSDDQIKHAVVALKDKLDVLKRIKNVEERLPNALTLVHSAGKA